MMPARELGGHGIGQQELDAIAVHDAGGVHADRQHQPVGIHEPVAFAALHLLTLLPPS
jgi:hypothetical protein